MTTKMKAPEGARAASVGNARYSVDATGHVHVLPEHADPLLAHGYVVVGDSPVAEAWSLSDEAKKRLAAAAKVAEKEQAKKRK